MLTHLNVTPFNSAINCDLGAKTSNLFNTSVSGFTTTEYQRPRKRSRAVVVDITLQVLKIKWALSVNLFINRHE